MVSTISFEGTDRPHSQMIFVGVSGEQATLHTINHITVNIELLGHSVSNLNGKDLKCILSNIVAPRHKYIMMPSVPRQHLLQMRGPYQLFIKEANGAIRDTSIVIRTNSSLHRGLEYLAFACVSTSESAYLYLVIDNTGKITDVNGIASRFFNVDDKFVHYNNDLATFLKDYKETTNLALCKPLPFANAALLYKMKDLSGACIEAEDIFKSWFILPIRPQNSTLPMQVYFKARLIPYNFKELVVTAYSLQLQRLKGMDYDTDYLSQGIITHSSSKLRPVTYSLDFEVESDSLAPSSRNLKLFQNKKKILKNAQQTDEYKMHSIPTQNRLPQIRPFPSPILSDIPLSMKPRAGGKTNSVVMNASNEVGESEGMGGPRARTERDKIKNDYEEYKNSQNIREFYGPHFNGRYAIRMSKFVHNNLILKSTWLTKSLFILPFLVQMIILAVILYKEAKNVKDFEKITTDIAILDSNESIHWVCKLHVFDISLSRMYLDGKVTDTQFNKFGFNGTFQHLAELATMPKFTSQMTLSIFRMNLKLQQSSHRSLHDNDWLQRTKINIKVYDERDNRFSFEERAVFDALRDTQNRIDSMFATPSNENTLIGLTKDRSESIDEILVSYNALNPVLNFFDQGSPRTNPSVSQRLRGLAGDHQRSRRLNYPTYEDRPRLHGSSTSVLHRGCDARQKPRIEVLPNELYFLFDQTQKEIEYIGKRIKDLQSFCSLNTLKVDETGNRRIVADLFPSQNGSILDMLSVSTKSRTVNGFRKAKNKSAKLSAKKGISYNVIGFPWMMMFKLFITLSLIAVSIILRYIYIDNQVAPKMELARLTTNCIDQYVHTLSVDIAMLEILNWDNQSEIQYMTPLKYFYKKVEVFRSRPIKLYESVLANPSGPNYEFVSKLLNEDVCEIFRKADANSLPYPNCEISLAGLAKNPLIFFLRQYLNLIEKFFSEWQLAKTYQERLALITRDEYSSIIAYAIHDYTGTADAMFYHMLLPMATRLTDRIEELSSHVSLSNVIFTVTTYLFTITLFRSAFYQFISMQENFWQVVKSIPFHLVQSNLILRNRMKQAYLHKSRFVPF